VRRRPLVNRAGQRGAAILTAMLTVVLVATLASAMLWQQWRGVEVESAQRSRVQAAWILTGALDWARLILREDARQGGADHLAEPWAVPLAPARLSTFLSAERGQALVTEGDDAESEAFLAGHIVDLQARLNVTNLIDNGKLHQPTVAVWARLFKHLNLPEQELLALTQSLLRAQASGAAAPASSAASATPATAAVTAATALLPQAVPELVWLGLSATTLQTLQPFITVLPERTVVNLNTAPPEVLLASVKGLDMAQAQALVQARAARHMDTIMDADRLVGNPQVQFDSAEQGVTSRFFSVTGQLKLGQTTLQEQSVLQRDGLQVKALSRVREQVGADARPLQ